MPVYQRQRSHDWLGPRPLRILPAPPGYTTTWPLYPHLEFYTPPPLTIDPTIFCPLQPDSFSPPGLRTAKRVHEHGLHTALKPETSQLVAASAYPWWYALWASAVRAAAVPKKFRWARVWEEREKRRVEVASAVYYYGGGGDEEGEGEGAGAAKSSLAMLDREKIPNLIDWPPGGPHTVFSMHPTDPWWPLDY